MVHSTALYHVVCPDDGIRHEEPFLTMGDALNFADHGHACLPVQDHRVTRWDASGLFMRPLADMTPWAPVDDLLTVVHVAEFIR